jgi:glycosyl-4,4'-diaponeurosporenoate acyltransferase
MTMPIIHLPETWTAVLYLLLWPVFQIAASLVCMKMPDRYFSPFFLPYREFHWEKGGFLYSRVLMVRKWKDLLPELGLILRGGHRKKALHDFTKQGLEKFLLESCRAEWTHLLAILLFVLLSFFVPGKAALFLIVYGLIMNLPCIIVQRYNRPRVIKLLKKLS